jgi:hypothetical protein
MNKRFVISVVVLFVASMLFGFVVHGLLLGPDYAKLQGLFRSATDHQAYFPYMLAAHVLAAVGLTWIYRAGRNSRPWLGQGVRFGLAVAVLTTIPTYLIYFAVQPMPSDLVAKQIVFDCIAMVLMGILTAALNRDPRTA